MIKCTKKKAQAAMEFVMVFSVLSIFVTAFLGAIYVNISQSKQKNEQGIVDDMANFIQQEIILASRVEDGYHRTFFLPEKIGGKPYNITLGDYALYVNTSKAVSIRGIPIVTNADSVKFYYQDNNTIIKNETPFYIFINPDR